MYPDADAAGRKGQSEESYALTGTCLLSAVPDEAQSAGIHPTCEAVMSYHPVSDARDLKIPGPYLFADGSGWNE